MRFLLKPLPPPDPRDTTGIDPELSADEITQQVVDIAGAYRGRTTIPAGSLFEVQEQEGKFYVTHEGEQFGPAMRDPIKAQEVKAALSERSDNLNVERIIRDSGIEYTPKSPPKSCGSTSRSEMLADAIPQKTQQSQRSPGNQSLPLVLTC